MNFLTQLGVLAIILTILVILLKSNQTLEQIYMEGEKEAKTIEMPSFKMPKKEKPVERSSATIPRETPSDWYIEMIDTMGRCFGRKNITAFPFTIGRNSDNDYVLDDLSVSGYHASLEYEGGIPRLVDKGSLNKILAGGREVTEINVTDRLEVALGNVRIRFGKSGTKEEPTNPYMQNTSKQNSWMEEWY